MTSSLNSSLSAILLGVVVSSIFYGITSLQAYFYLYTYRSDRLLYRVAVAVLWLLDTVHLILAVYFLYLFTITEAGRMFKPGWSSSTLVIIAHSSDLIIRTVFLHRIRLLSEKKKTSLLAPLGLVILSTAAIGIYYGIEMYTATFFNISRISWALYAALTGDVVADLGITISLCLQFSNMRSGIKSTDTFLNILIAYTVNTGLLTCAIAVGTLITYALMSEDFIYMGIFVVLNKAAFNSLLATLNARSHYHDHRAAAHVDSKSVPYGTSPQITLVDENGHPLLLCSNSMGTAV